MPFSLTAKRRLIQFLALILLTSNFTVFTVNSVFFGAVCLPVIHCNACPLTWFACPIYTISEFLQFHAVPWLALGLIAAFGVLVGRLFCGWICPMGLLQELLDLVPTPKLKLPRFLRWLKYAFLFISVGAVAYWAGKEVLYFFCKYCPVAALEVLLPQMLQDGDWTMDAWRMLRLSVLVFVLVIVIFNGRWFCKAMCPVGALVAFFNRFALFRIRLDAAACIHCGKCDKTCPMLVPVEACSRTGRAVNRHSECIACLKCQQVCPTHAIGNSVGRLIK
jgi:polyferredoxin